MPNAHLRTAADNLQRAVSDVHELQSRLHSEIEKAKREEANRTNEINRQIADLERKKNNRDESSSEKLADSIRQQKLVVELSTLHANTENFIRQQNQKLSELDGQVREFENLASHLNMLA